MGFKSLGLRTKIMFAVGLACSICAAVAMVIAVKYNNIEFRNGLIERSRTIHSRLESASRYVARQGGLQPITEEYKKKYKSSDMLTDEDKKLILNQVPIYAAMEIGADESAKENYTFRVFSDEPRNIKNKATPEEMEIINKFAADPSLNELTTDKENIVTVYRPVRLVESHNCLVCHGDPATSPWGNGKDILGYRMENWKDGKLRGVFAISNDVSKIQQALASLGKPSSTTSLAIFIFIGAVGSLLMAAFITHSPISSLKNAAENLNKAEDQVTVAATQIARSSQSLSNSTTQQASSLEETVATMEELTSMIRLNTENSKQAASLAASTREIAVKGEKEIKTLIESIHGISADSKRIAEITGVIDDIAFQTNLLALNAAVEAARAGEQGKGFAVVAEAVRSLAQRSSTAAKDIAELINQSVEKIENGNNQANQGGIVLGEIVNAVNKVVELNTEIASASEEQSNGIGQISKAMNQMDQVTQNNAASSGEAAAAAEDLASQANSLKETVGTLDKIITGSAA
ncbi:MAG: methyl-accepting chemotaxis protein [Pseudobdellovibrionaceae bacterium]